MIESLPPGCSFIKELLADFAAAQVDKLFETKGLDFLDREKAKHRAIHQAHDFADEQYGQGGVYNQQWEQYGNEPINHQQQRGYGYDQFDDGNNQQQGGKHHQHF